MHKVKVMIDPANCLICGRGNTVDHPMEDDEFWAVDTERDVNWGDNAYVCFKCCDDFAHFAGHVPAETAEELERTVAKHLKKIHELEAKLELKERRLTAMIEGHNARAQEKKERVKKAKPKRKKAAA